jgi:hypothetical protein
MKDKRFRIHEGDVGTQAFNDWYVRELEADKAAITARVAELTSLLKAAADEDSGCYMMGTGWHGKVRNAIADVEKS